MVCDRVPPVEEVRLFQYSTNSEITRVPHGYGMGRAG
jgi:hypothetical protein